MTESNSPEAETVAAATASANAPTPPNLAAFAPNAADSPAPLAGDSETLRGETNVFGDPLRETWLATVAVVWCGQAASVFATCAASFAAMWYITETTSSAVWLSLASAAALLPVALLSPFGGVAADRFERKRVMIVADGSAGAFSLALALTVLGGFASVPLILLLLAVRAAGQAFHGPALSALMPGLVPERHLVRINAMDQAITSLSSIAGPALGMLLYTLVGLGGVMVLDAACAAIACCCLAAARIPANAGRGTSASASVFADLKEGAAIILRDAGLRDLMILVMVTMLLFMPISSLTPLMTYAHFNGTGWQESLVEAVFGIGLLAGSAVVMVWGGGKRRALTVATSGVALGLALAACGLLGPGQFPAFAILIGISAAAMGSFNAPLLPIMQMRAPAAALGRVVGIFLTGSSLAAPIGLAFSGFIAESIGISTWFTVCGTATAACCAAGYVASNVRKLDEHTDAA